MEKNSLLKSIWNRFMQPILIGGLAIVILFFTILYKIKDTPTFKRVMNTYTEYYNVQYNGVINNVHSILSYYKNGGIELMVNIDGLTYKKTDSNVTITQLVREQYEPLFQTLSLDAIKNVNKEEKVNENQEKEYVITLEELKKLDEKIVYKKDRAILEKILNMDLVNRHSVQTINDPNKYKILKGIEKVQSEQNFISKMLFGDNATLGKAELKKIESKEKIDDKHSKEMESQEVSIKQSIDVNVSKDTNNTKKDTNTTEIKDKNVTAPDLKPVQKVQELDYKSEVQKMINDEKENEQKQKELKEQQSIIQKENQKNGTLNLKNENYGESEYGKENKKVKETNLVIPKIVKENRMNNEFERFDVIKNKEIEKPKEIVKDRKSQFKELE